MRLSIRVNWEICCWPADDRHGHAYSVVVIAVQFCRCGLSLPSFDFVAFAFGFASWCKGGPVSRYSTLILH